MKLIIVENVANPFRCVFESPAVRRRILSELAQRFLKIAYEHDVAVVFTNEMTQSKSGEVLPSLGKRLIPYKKSIFQNNTCSHMYNSLDKTQGSSVKE